MRRRRRHRGRRGGPGRRPWRCVTGRRFGRGQDSTTTAAKSAEPWIFVMRAGCAGPRGRWVNGFKFCWRKTSRESLEAEKKFAHWWITASGENCSQVDETWNLSRVCRRCFSPPELPQSPRRDQSLPCGQAVRRESSTPVCRVHYLLYDTPESCEQPFPLNVPSR